MKVIAKVDSDKYICEVDHAEIEKFMDLYYGKMKKLNVNDIINLGEGYDYADKSRRALEETREFFKKNADNIKAITNAFLLESKEITQ
ncbi:MAG: hypothetical protein PHF21_02665 [Bacilli bacterium]|nr:hypothetical protein [Bacilli bacterium]